MPASPAGPLAPSIKHNDLDVSPLKVHERSKPDHFYSKALASSAHLLRLPSSSSICFISCCSEQVLKHRTWKKKKKKDEEILKEKKKKPFLTFCPLSLPLYNPLSGFSSKSNLAHVSIPTHPPHSSPPLLPLPLTPRLSLFLLVPHPFLLPLPSPSFPHHLFSLSRSPLSLPSRSSPLPSRYRPSLYLLVATWKATCALIARGEAGQRVN